MITNLFVAYLISTNVFATNHTDTLRVESVQRVITYSLTIEGQLIQDTNRVEIARRWMHGETELVEIPDPSTGAMPSGLFTKITRWFEVPPPMRATMMPPMPPPPPLPSPGVSTLQSTQLTNNVGPRVPP